MPAKTKVKVAVIVPKKPKSSNGSETKKADKVAVIVGKPKTRRG